MDTSSPASMSEEENRLVKVMNLSPEEIKDFRDRPLYQDAIRKYRNPQYRWLHLARKPKRQTETAADLCLRCRSIDFQAIFNLQRDDLRGIPVFDLGPVELSSPNGCRLCEIVTSKFQTIKATNSSAYTSMWRLEIFPALWTAGSVTAEDMLKHHKKLSFNILGEFPCDTGSQVLGPIMDRWIFPMEQQHSSAGSSRAFYQGRPLNPRSIDYGYLRFRLQQCIQEHRCSATERLSISPERINVIDCATKRLQPLPNGSRYICLSYVWGTDHTPTTKESAFVRQTGCLPEILPETVRDAITVVRNLSERYLWVDRYCSKPPYPRVHPGKLRHRARSSS